jgi:hypothetical protein
MITSALLMAVAPTISERSWSAPMIEQFLTTRLKSDTPSMASDKMIVHLRQDGVAVLPVRAFALKLRQLKCESVLYYIRDNFSQGVQVTVGDFGSTERANRFKAEFSIALKESIRRRPTIDAQHSKSWKNDAITLQGSDTYLQDKPGQVLEILSGTLRRSSGKEVVDMIALGKVLTFSTYAGYTVHTTEIFTARFDAGQRTSAEYLALAGKVLDRLNEEFSN